MSWQSAKPWNGLLAPVRGSGHIAVPPGHEEGVDVGEIEGAAEGGSGNGGSNDSGHGNGSSGALLGSTGSSGSDIHAALEKSFLGLPFNRALVLSIAMRGFPRLARWKRRPRVTCP